MNIVSHFIPNNVITLTGGWLLAYGCFYGINSLMNSFEIHPLLQTSEGRLHLSSRTVSMIHAVGTLYLASLVVINDPLWTVSNTNLQNQLMSFSQSYYLADTLYVALLEWDPIFLIHHGVMVAYWGSCFYLKQGGYFGAVVMIPGEITNPVQLSWDLARRYRIEPAMRILTPIFTYSFLTVRCGIFPILSPYIWHHIWKNPTPSKTWKLFWIFLNLSIMGAGFHWSGFLWRGYVKYLERQL